MKRLIIDAQVFHTPAFHRGMGKYSVELLRSLLQVNGSVCHWDAVELLLSSRMPLATDVLQTIHEVVGETKIVRLPLKKDVIYEAQSIMRHNRRVVDGYIANLRRHNPDEQIDFLILSPLQGGISCVFPSDTQTRKGLICYDLIPFLFHTTYFRNPIARIENLTKLTELLTADVFLTISQTVANDLAVHLGVDPARICNIDGGAINHSTKSKKLSVPTPFILMPTGNDLRKNNQTGILGFAEFNKRHNNAYSLVITSFFDPAEVAAFSKMAPNIVFTGNVGGDELNYLYETCDALLFPSLYEGLGLPVLEAAEKGKPVACSDIAVFREMSKTAFTFFDPKLGTAIARALDTALTHPVDQREYHRVLARYDWKYTAQRALDALTNVSPLPGDMAKPDVVIVGVNPTQDHPVARLMQSSYAELSRRMSVCYRLEGEDLTDGPRPNMLHFVQGSQRIDGLLPIDLKESDCALYFLTDSPATSKTLFAALARPGVACLYTLSLGEAWQGLLDTGVIAESRLDAERRLQAAWGKDTHTHLLCSALAHQRAVVVFDSASAAAVKKLLRHMGKDVPVYTLSPPSASLVYDDIIPAKDSVVVGFDPEDDFSWLDRANRQTFTPRVLVRPGTVAMSGIETVSVAGDLEYEDALSRAKASSSVSNSLRILDGMRYGVVPLNSRGEDAATINATLASLANAETFVEASQKTRMELSQGHAYAGFAKAIAQIFVDLNEKGR